jgi:23S rRNA (adenine-N6)-dimethyltransferase
VAARERAERGSAQAVGQHFLRSPSIAAELAEQAGIRSRDLVFEIGAGTGRLTTALADRGADVLAIEIDPELAERLRRRFAGIDRVCIIEGDALEVLLPACPFRAFGNVPFAITTPVLRRLLDPRSLMTRADLIVQLEVARKRSAVWPTTLLSLSWGPWWTFALTRQLPAAAFDPIPTVDAGVLTVERRDRSLLGLDQREDLLWVLRTAFDRSSTPIQRSLAIPRPAWKRLARDRGLPPQARPFELDLFDWLAVYRLLSGRRR